MKQRFKKIIFTSTIITLILFVINKIISNIAILNDLLRKGYGNYYEWRFGKIYYTKHGHGTPILLIHDLTVYSSSYEWKKTVKKLAETNMVYTIDLLGCGRSDKPVLTYTNFLYVQLLSDFIKNIIGEKTNIAATGLSGSFVLMLCNNEPSLINKIILINPESIAYINQPQTKRKKMLKLLLSVPVIGTTAYNIMINKKKLEHMFCNNLFYHKNNINQKDIDTCFEACQLSGPNGKYLLGSICGGYLSINITHALKSINNSIYIIGSSEISDNQSVIENYVSYNASIETTYIEKAGKLPHMESPDKITEYINIFL